MLRQVVIVVACLCLMSARTGYGQNVDAFAVAARQATETLQDAIDTGVVGSAIGLIALSDQLVVLYSGGEIGPGEPMPVNAIARVASIQKPITATAVLVLHDRGLLELQTPVDRWLPGFGDRVITPDGDTVETASRPTVFDLLTHQAGLIAEGPELEALWDAPTNQEFARRIGELPLRFAPGSRFEYGCCGAAYEVLAAIVERVSGQSFKDFLSSSVLDPLGMSDTYFFVPADKRHRLAAHYGHDQAGELTTVRARGQEEPPIEFYSGGGGLRSTVLDFHRFALMMLNGGELDGVRLLRPETVRMMTSNQVGAAYPASGYGWGFGVRVRLDGAPGGEPGSGSFGWVGGTGTAFQVDPESGRIAIVFLPTWPGTSGVSQVRDDFIRAAAATTDALRSSR